jgi:cell wall-associated NlpC family hydrolase
VTVVSTPKPLAFSTPIYYFKTMNYKKILPIVIFLLPLLFSCTTTYMSDPSARSARQERLVRQARAYVGVPYRYGGMSRSGMDCSGLVVLLFREACGIRLPHSTGRLWRTGTAIPLRSMTAGDLVFFRISRESIPSHVGVYLGRGRFIHASSSRGVVISKLSEDYYKRRLIGVRRIL